MSDSTRSSGGRSIACAVAAVFALAAFLVALAAAAATGRDAESALVRAIASMAICWPVGFVAARIMEGQFGPARTAAEEGAGNPRADAEVRRDRGVADARDRRRDIIGTVGPEENPTMRQELRPHSRST